MVARGGRGRPSLCHECVIAERPWRAHSRQLLFVAAGVIAAACSSQTPPGTNESHGQYRYTRSEAAWLVSDDRHRYAVLVPRSREIWIGQDGSGRLVEDRSDPLFYGVNDRREWNATSPLEAHIDTRFARGEMAVLSADGLPTDKTALRAKLLESADQSEPESVAVLVAALGYLRETVPSTEAIGLLYDTVAHDPGITRSGLATDHAARQGEVFSVDIPGSVVNAVPAERLTAIFDSGSHRLLEEQRAFLEGDAAIDTKPPVTVGWATFYDARIVADTESR